MLQFPSCQEVQLLAELLVEHAAWVLPENPLERLEGKNELPLIVKHLSLGFNQFSSIVFITSVEHIGRLIVDASHLEGGVDVLPQILVRYLLQASVIKRDCLDFRLAYIRFSSYCAAWLGCCCPLCAQAPDIFRCHIGRRSFW